MTPPQNHPQELLGPAALGLLTSVEQQELDRHLRGCAACRDELQSLSATSARLSALDERDALSLDLASSRARADAVLASVGRVRAQERRRSHRLQSLLGAAASAAVLVAGLVTAAALTQEQEVPLEAVAVDAQDGVQASADLVAHTWGVEIKLEATGLAAGRPYTVVVTSSSGRVADAGAFLGTGDAPLLCNLNTSVLRPDAESFTVRDASGRTVLTADL